MTPATVLALASHQAPPPAALHVARSADAAGACLVRLPNGLRLVVTAPVAPAWLGAVVAHLR